jgi:hypothetical protein
VPGLIVFSLVIIEIVNQADQPPVFYVLAKMLGHPAHTGFDRENMFQEVVMPDFFQNQPVCFFTSQAEFHDMARYNLLLRTVK